jgi:hypothetical protein
MVRTPHEIVAFVNPMSLSPYSLQDQTRRRWTFIGGAALIEINVCRSLDPAQAFRTAYGVS